MKLFYNLILVMCMPASLFGQLSLAQQKALNNYVELGNKSGEDISTLVRSLHEEYEIVLNHKEDQRRQLRLYLCRTDFKPDYFEQALKESTALGQTESGSLNAMAKRINEYWQKLDEECKSVEIYFRLEDYKRDDFSGFMESVKKIGVLVQEYSNERQHLGREVDRVFRKLQPVTTGNNYVKVDYTMRDQLKTEWDMLNSMTLNLNERVHTGWPVEKLQSFVLENDKRIGALKQNVPVIKYPASSMYNPFVEGLESMQKTIRSAVDDYTYEKKQSDKHSNDLYFDLINYYNGVAVSFYNMFHKYAANDGYRGIMALNYVPVYEIRTQALTVDVSVKPFTDVPFTKINVTPSVSAIPVSTFNALESYVDLINEGLRQIHNMTQPMRNLNSSASYIQSRMKEGRTPSITHYYKDFTTPVSLFQQTLSQSSVIPAAYRKSLNDQATTLQNILTEISDWNTVLLAESESKTLARDSGEYVYSILERFVALVDAYDERKENLYKDVRAIYESYKVTDGTSSWRVSGKALLELVDLNHSELFKAKDYFKEQVHYTPAVDPITSLSRTLIVNEYTNLKGIQKLGRYNGKCPYSPYEDIPKYSNLFVERLNEVTSKQIKDGRGHPYNELIYTYNQNIIHEYNRFSELSPVKLLQYITQPELITIKPPVESKPRAITTQPEPTVETQPTRNELEPVSGSVIRDTVRVTDIIRIETIRQDTIYIERHDTVYVSTPGEDFMSMEGYATNNMVFLLDVSGSMNAPEKLPLLKKSVLLLLKMMREEDEVSIVVYSGKAKVLLQPTSFKDEEKITKIIERLKSEGKTDGAAGIRLAYEIADKNYIRGGNNRIILATDGEFPVGNEITELVQENARQDIFLSVFNFGKGAGASKNLQNLAGWGNGNYEQITRVNIDTKLIREAKAKRKK